MRTDQLRVTGSRTLRKGFYAVLVMSMVAATESFSQTPTLAEALDTPGLTWSSGGAGVWTGQTSTSHDGVDSAQGNLPIGDRESWIETTVAGPAQTTFWCKLYPTSDVEVQLQVNGETQITSRENGSWLQSALFLPAGNCVLRWRLVAPSSRAFPITAWIDQIAIVPGATPPTISLQPTSRTISMDDMAVLQSAASGTPPLHYQWYFEDTAVWGATNPSLTLPSMKRTNEGSYFMVVSNDYHSATSSPAILTLKEVPMFAFVSHGGTGSNMGSGIAVDQGGNIYVTGQFTDSLDLGATNLVSAGGTDAFMARYDHGGKLVWAKRVGGAGNDASVGVAVDPFGFIYFSGSVTGLTSFDSLAWTNSTGLCDYMAKYDSSGGLLWVRTNPAAAHLVFDAGGHAYLSGFSGGTIFMDEYDSGGNLLHRRWAYSSTPAGCYGRGVTAIDSGTNIYVGGLLSDTLTLTNAVGSNVVLRNYLTYRHTIILVKFNASGQAVWVRGFGGGYEEPDGDIFRIVVDDLDNTYTSMVVGTDHGSDSRLAKHDGNGSLLWANSFGFRLSDLGIFNGTNVYGAGQFSYSAFGSMSAGGFDAFVARMDSRGRIVEARRAGGAGNDSALAMALDQAGNACLTGYFQGTANFGNQTLSSGGPQDFFVARLQTAVPALNSRQTNNQVRLSWDAMADGFVLESIDDLSLPFVASSLVVQTNASEFVVIEPMAEAKRFYRLRRP